MVTFIEINGRCYIREVDFERADVICPSAERPYWQINLYLENNVVERIVATGQVLIVRTEKLKKEEKWVVE